jgi:ATP-dependent Clp protease, protease subunit
MHGTTKMIDNDKLEDSTPTDEKINGHFLTNHTHYLNGDLDEEKMNRVIRWVIYENLKDGDDAISLYINSDGGSLCETFALIDMMRSSRKPINVVAIGSICSAAFLIFAAGTPGRRHIGRNTTIMCHQYSEGVEGKYHDLRARISENKRMNDRMVKLLTECSNLSETKVRSKLLPPSDVWMSANELVEFGIADLIF